MMLTVPSLLERRPNEHVGDGAEVLQRCGRSLNVVLDGTPLLLSVLTFVSLLLVLLGRQFANEAAADVLAHHLPTDAPTPRVVPSASRS
jgi:hypothetical protein